MLQFLRLKLDQVILFDNDTGIGSAGPVTDLLHNTVRFRLAEGRRSPAQAFSGAPSPVCASCFCAFAEQRALLPWSSRNCQDSYFDSLSRCVSGASAILSIVECYFKSMIQRLGSPGVFGIGGLAREKVPRCFIQVL